jgi:2-polyprenyl-3-methyl-5-hydroxy-6-metoxy-1,4-benzoquinol methylase
VAFEDVTAVPSLVSSAFGVVLDLGAGNGNQLHRLDKEKIKHVYGIEPNKAFVGALDAKIKETGLEGLYTPLICGVEDAEMELSREGVTPGTVDCIVSIQILCSVKDPEAVVKQLHHLLKPGGELIFWEHQQNESDFITRIAQCKKIHSLIPLQDYTSLTLA